MTNLNLIRWTRFFSRDVTLVNILNSALLLISWIIFLILPANLSAQKLQYLKTPNAQLVHYSSAHQYILPHLAKSYENSLKFYQELFHYTPTEPLTLFLQDFSDWGNAGATAVPSNYITVYISPFHYAYETVPTYERMTWLMNHETVHIVAMDQANAGDRFFQNLFLGKVMPNQNFPVSLLYGYLTNPRRYAPRWYHEGIACFLETWTAGGLGRVQNPYYEMEFRTVVKEDQPFYNVVQLESEGTAIDFQVGALSYLYGTRFFSYLAEIYGPEKLIEWTQRTDRSKSYFSSQFKNVYGINLKDSWHHWILWEEKWQQDNLMRIRNHPVTESHPLSKKSMGSVSRAFIDSSQQNLYFAVQFPGEVAHIMQYDLLKKRSKKLCDIKGPALYYVSSLAFDEKNQKLFFTCDNLQFRDLYVYHLKSGQKEKLVTNLRAGDLAFNRKDFSLWAVRHNNGISTIIRLEPPYHDWKALHAFQYGTDPYDLDISPDGLSLSASLSQPNGHQKLVIFSTTELENNSDSLKILFDFENSAPANFVYSQDGKFLFGSSYYSGVSNIYRYEIEKNDMSIITNCETGLFRPTPISQDSLIAFYYSSKGFSPVRIGNTPLDEVSAIKYQGQGLVEKYPILKSWIPDSPKNMVIDSLIEKRGTYSSWRDLNLGSAYPVLLGYKNWTAMGYFINVRNNLGFNRLNLTIGYTPQPHVPQDENIHIDLNYHFWQWSFEVGYNRADFYDLFGPTKISRKGYFASLSYEKQLIYDPPRKIDFTFNISGYGGLEKLPNYQNVNAPFSSLYSTDAKISFEHVRKSLGAVEEEKGYRFSIASLLNVVQKEAYPRFLLQGDIGFALPVPHSSVWFNNFVGASLGEIDNPFTNYYFGGFGNNWIDRRSEKRYREFFSFPGFEINALGGRTFIKSTLELNLPPVRFKNLGNPAFYFMWARFSLFTSGLVTNFDNSFYRREVVNLGGQIDLRSIMLSLQPVTFSLGYAIGLEQKHQLYEFMFSVKIFD